MIIIDALITCGKAPEVTENPDGTYDVRLFDPNHQDLLECFEMDDFIDHFDEDKILEHIGESAAIQKFNLITEYELGAVQEELDNLKREQDINQQMKEYKEMIADQKAYIPFEDKPKNQ